MTPLSSYSSSSPISSSLTWHHDVFLSFRGEDTRKTFVDHLYAALVGQRIDTFKDDELLVHGESIGPSLLKAIEESQIAVIVFSMNYAESSWCLDELAHIMKCKDTRGQIVLPIFYGVDPSTVRKLKGKYAEAFVKHRTLVNYNKVESWRKALFDASNLSGWEPKNIANGHESKAIKEIVDNISSRLRLITSNANEHLIRIASRVHNMILELQIGSGGMCMIGIWRVGSGGKTTLVQEIAVGKLTREALITISDEVEDLVDDLSDEVEDLLEEVKDLVQEMDFDRVKELTRKALITISGEVEDLVDDLSDEVEDLSYEVKNLVQEMDFDRVKELTRKALITISDEVEDLVDDLSDEVEDLSDEVKDLVQEMDFDRGKELTRKALITISGEVEDLVDDLSDEVEDLSDEVKDLVQEMDFDRVKELARKSLITISDEVEDLMDDLSDEFEDWLEGIDFWD